MILIGLFSTHLTYLLLAAIYIFGYGAYTLNCKQKQGEMKSEPAKQIAFDTAKADASSLQQNDSFYWEDAYSVNVVEGTSHETAKFSYDIFEFIKPTRHFCSLHYYLRLSGSISSRPPPFFV